MIGSGLKKFAARSGMRVSSGMAFGELRGYSAVMSEGSGWKSITVNTRILNPEQGAYLASQLEDAANRKRFNLREATVSAENIRIVFVDTVGTMKRIEAFADWFFPLLDGCSAQKYTACDICGGELNGAGQWKRVGGTALHMHSECARALEERIRSAEQENAENISGSYLSGVLGALLGALLGAVAWAVVYEFGYVASIVGVLIAFLAVKGYELLKGKPGKGMTVVILLAVIFGVAMGNLMAYVWEIYGLVRSGDLPITVSQIPLFLRLMLEDGDFVAILAKDLLMGLAFGLLGAFSILRRTAAAVSPTKIEDLK